MKKNSFKIFIISTSLVVMILLIGLYSYDKKTTMTCKRLSGEVVIFKFDIYGIKSMKINNKSVTGADLLNYKVKFYNKLSLNSTSDMMDNYEEIKKYMSDVKKYEELRSSYYSKCDFED